MDSERVLVIELVIKLQNSPEVIYKRVKLQFVEP